MEKYKLKPEHEARLPEWRDKWIANAFKIRKEGEKPDIEVIRKHVKGLYEAADLTPPPDHRIILVASPFIARFASGFAAWIWYLRKKVGFATEEATRAATDAATYGAIDAATSAATRDATRAATDATTYYATEDATRAATEIATETATDDAAEAATYDTTDAATYYATEDATRVATYDVTDTAIDDATRAATDAATRDATDDAVREATLEATHAATYNATHVATDEATHAATYAATYTATEEATSAATEEATRAATDDAEKKIKNEKFNKWYQINGDMSKLALKIFKNKDLAKAGLNCTYKAYKFYQGGNMWSWWYGLITFFRYIAKLDIDYSKWDHFEKLGGLTGFRYMHEKFCILSDFPTKLEVDDNNEPHCEDGPYIQWADGSCMYCWHGVRVPAWIIEFPEAISVEKIQEEENLEVQRIMIERYGVSRYLTEIEAKILDMDNLGLVGSATRALMEDNKGNLWLIGSDGSTERIYSMAVENVKTCKEAHEQLCGFDESRLIAEC